MSFLLLLCSFCEFKAFHPLGLCDAAHHRHCGLISHLLLKICQESAAQLSPLKASTMQSAAWVEQRSSCSPEFLTSSSPFFSERQFSALSDESSHPPSPRSGVGGRRLNYNSQAIAWLPATCSNWQRSIFGRKAEVVKVKIVSFLFL